MFLLYGLAQKDPAALTVKVKSPQQQKNTWKGMWECLVDDGYEAGEAPETKPQKYLCSVHSFLSSLTVVDSKDTICADGEKPEFF